MQGNKSPITAFFLSVFPGVGHAYLGRPVRFVLYGGGFFGSLGLLLLMAMTHSYEGNIIIFLMFVAAVSWIINMIDMIVSLLNGAGQPRPVQPYVADPGMNPGWDARSFSYEQRREKTQTILLSFLPGVGHMAMGMLQRGLAFLVAFIGLLAITIFISIITNTGSFLVFLLALPVIWIYTLFDAVQQLQRKHRGETIDDKPFFEELEEHIGSGKKNKVLAATLSLFPGAGHLYLGLQKRGLQIMGGFLISIFLMDSLRLSIFLFLMPLFWFFAFFDALQQMSRYESNQLKDQAVVAQLAPYQKWIGLALLVLGAYYLLDQVMGTYISQTWPAVYREFMKLKYNLPTALVAFVMIAAGLRLVFGGGSRGGSGGVPSEAPPRLPEWGKEERS
ncbi:hypothetical protein [Paenibacillus radicis (ex Gao et al. 2016)]|uniref:Multi-tm2 domain protein n=1 Tax=Paenibacillus radicis (ex Gao et al. 2016) TaxID=1737354 RepID=A0A917HRB6_9BACL|nr:hypothetical protein [Paenibacillus radicis (ex Gao et al. 2016)]GGG86904.1 hypothetical protein GCM10010918_51420 [Paenibacillus radicis (ex Gao et al. 2016)]